MDGSLLKVGEIHRDLGQAAHEEARALDETHATAGEAHGLSNLLCDLDIRCVQENVIGDQELSGAHDRRTGCGMNACFANIGASCRIGPDFGTNSFKLSPSNILQTLPF